MIGVAFQNVSIKKGFRMKKSLTDYRLLGGIFFAYLLIYVTYGSKSSVFWYLYTATILFLISYAIINEKLDDEVPTKQYLAYGVISGLALYFLFFVGNWMLTILPGSLDKQVVKIYARYPLEWVWHYLVLIFIIVPGEEIFWRGFVQKRLMKYMNQVVAVFVAAAINAAALYFSGFTILIVAAFMSGIVWGLLYMWKRSIPLLIVSHLTFDLLLLIILPLY